MEENTKQKQCDNEFATIYRANIKREGADKLLDYLYASDFFTAPASSKFHSAYSGGLCTHSVNVYKRLVWLLQNEYGDKWSEKFSKESIAIVGLLHDICKVDYYKESFRNVKVNGQWEQQPYFTIEDGLPYGHGEKSVYIISGFMHLTRDEAMAINWHMGGFDDRARGGSYAIGQVFSQYPLAVFAHSADFLASHLDE